jgi:hypothetical protein
MFRPQFAAISAIGSVAESAAGRETALVGVFSIHGHDRNGFSLAGDRCRRTHPIL